VQTDYQAASSLRERRAIALDFEEEAQRAKIATNGDRLSVFNPTLAVAGFFAQTFRHQKGPAAGQPFVLEPRQRAFVGRALPPRRAQERRGAPVYEERGVLSV
jgi:hypothetical protein